MEPSLYQRLQFQNTSKIYFQDLCGRYLTQVPNMDAVIQIMNSFY